MSGICIPFIETKWNPYDNVDYARHVDWNLNTVCYYIAWFEIEPDETAPQVYDEDALIRLEREVALAHSHGLKVFFSVFHNKGGSWGWPGQYSADYVNLNQLDASGRRGRERYIAMLTMLAQRFPSVAIDPWRFPYHAEPYVLREPDPLAQTRITTFYSETQPAFLKALRQVTNQPIVLNPLKQGISIDSQIQSGGLDDQPYYAADRNVFYGLNSKSAYGRIAILGDPWDYDQAELDRQWQPVANFKARYPNAKMICVEFGGLNIHGAGADQRPIEQSRLDWLEATMKKAQDLGVSWFYHRYEKNPAVETPQETDGSDTAVAELIAQYAVTPTSPLAPIIVAGTSVAVIFWWLLS